MDSIVSLIDLLTVAEKNDFVSSLKKKNKRDDVKNIQLFEFLKTDDIDKINLLYESSENKDAYHALRKRLHDSLLIFLSQRTFENNNSETYDALRLLVVGRFLLENDLPKIALKCLNKAKELAFKTEQYSLIHDILLLKMQYQHLLPSENLLNLITEVNENQLQIQRETKVHTVYALLRRELIEIQLNGKIVNLTSFIVKTIRYYRISMNDFLTYKSLYQILSIANEYAAIQQNYSLIEKYISKAYDFLKKRDTNQSSEGQLYYHLSILYYLANFCLRSRNFEESLAYLADMKCLSTSYKSFDRQFAMKYHLLLGLNYHFIGNSEYAITVLKDVLASSNKSKKFEDIADLRISLSMFYAQQNDRESIRHLSLLTHTDAWYEKRLGMLWTIRKSLMEILIHAQFENIDLADAKIQTFKRRYKKYLLKVKEERVLHFLKLVEQYLSKPDVVFEVTFQNKVKLMLNGEFDVFTLSFVAWIIARWEKKTPYKVLLDLLEHSH